MKAVYLMALLAISSWGLRTASASQGLQGGGYFNLIEKAEFPIPYPNTIKALYHPDGFLVTGGTDLPENPAGHSSVYFIKTDGTLAHQIDISGQIGAILTIMSDGTVVAREFFSRKLYFIDKLGQLVKEVTFSNSIGGTMYAYALKNGNVVVDRFHPASSGTTYERDVMVFSPLGALLQTRHYRSAGQIFWDSFFPESQVLSFTNPGPNISLHPDKVKEDQTDAVLLDLNGAPKETRFILPGDCLSGGGLSETGDSVIFDCSTAELLEGDRFLDQSAYFWVGFDGKVKATYAPGEFSRVPTYAPLSVGETVTANCDPQGDFTLVSQTGAVERSRRQGSCVTLSYAFSNGNFAAEDGNNFMVFNTALAQVGSAALYGGVGQPTSLSAQEAAALKTTEFTWDDPGNVFHLFDDRGRLAFAHDFGGWANSYVLLPGNEMLAVVTNKQDSCLVQFLAMEPRIAE